MIEKDHELSVRKQVGLMGVSRSSLYYQSILGSDSELANLISELYLESECRYGYRKITQVICQKYFRVNKKKVLRIMQEVGIQGRYPKRSCVTTTPDKEHLKYPYLLDGLEIIHPNQVWATDITYIKVQDRFMYLMAIVDLFSRYVVSYELSPTLEATFCIDLLKKTLMKFQPKIFNTDQGSQFTCKGFVCELERYGIAISMDHKGRCFDNIIVERFWRSIKQEAIYFYRPETVKELEDTVSTFIDWYNNKRIHQSLGYKTPVEMYRIGGSLLPPTRSSTATPLEFLAK